MGSGLKGLCEGTVTSKICTPLHAFIRGIVRAILVLLCELVIAVSDTRVFFLNYNPVQWFNIIRVKKIAIIVIITQIIRVYKGEKKIFVFINVYYTFLFFRNYPVQ